MTFIITDIDRGNGQGCEICKLAFSRQAALYEHYRRKHSIVFDAVSQESSVKAKKLKNRVERVKTKPEKAKVNPVKAGVSLLHDVTQQTTAAISLPNGLSYNVKVDNSNNVKDDIGQLNDTTIINDAATLIKTGQLTSTHGVHEVPHSDLSTDPALYSNSILPGSSLLVSSSGLSGSSNLTGSSVLVIMGPQTGYTINSTTSSVCATQASKILVLPDTSKSNATSALTDLYNHQNHQDYEKDGDHSCIDKSVSKCNNLDNRTQTVFAKSFHKQISHNRTEAYGQSVSQTTDKVKGPSNNETKLDSFKTEVCQSVSKESSIVKSLSNDSTGIQENLNENYIIKPEEQTVYSKPDEEDQKAVTDKRSMSKSLAYCTRNFKKRGRLAPVSGKIPQELDMPDFCFIYFVTHGGKNEKSMHVGKDQFKCLFCTYVVRWRNSMCRHMREEHENELLSGAALMTPSQTASENGKVMKMTEYIAMEKAEKPNKRIRGVETQDMLGEYTCEQCGKVFNRLRYWRMHIQSHKRKKDVLCALCSKTFKTQQNLIQHLKSHEEREPYKCPECDFVSSVNIAIHKHRQIHSGNSQICEICGQAYSDKSTLKKHKQVHDPSRPFGCSISGCTWRFRTKTMCDAHIQGHGSKRTFKCEVCGYAFRQKHHLQRHEKVVHNIVHEPKPSYSSYYSNKDTEFSDNQFEDISNDGQNEMEVPQGVNLIMNDGNISNVITPDHFDLESALQNGQLVIATDDGSINYEMSDISSNVVYQTLLPDGEAQHFETQTICIPQTDPSSMVYEEVEAVQSEVEIEQS